MNTSQNGDKLKSVCKQLQCPYWDDTDAGAKEGKCQLYRHSKHCHIDIDGIFKDLLYVRREPITRSQLIQGMTQNYETLPKLQSYRRDVAQLKKHYDWYDYSFRVTRVVDPKSIGQSCAQTL